MNLKCYLLLFSAFLFFTTACESGIDKDLIIGKWKGVKYEEEGQVVEGLNPSELIFDFSEEGDYTSQKPFGNSEAGEYTISGNILFAKQYGAAENEETRVEIQKLSQDSLIILMMDNNKEQRVSLVKE